MHTNILQALESKDYCPYIKKEELSICENCEGYSETSKSSNLSSLYHKKVCTYVCYDMGK